MLPRLSRPRVHRSTTTQRRGSTGSVRRAVAAVGAAAVLLTGCSTPVKNQAPVAGATSSATPEAPEPGLEPFYSQPVEWTACGDFQCATVTVPIDYAEPAAGSAEVAIKRAPARSGEPMASLLVNPGGPGASGTEFLEYALPAISESVRDRFDVVGLDPRGVGASTAIRCLDDHAKDEMLSRDVDVATEAGRQEAAAAYRALGEACAANTGPLLAHVDTVSAARDLDVLRAVLGDETLHFLGYSYATFLGATYAGLFPERAGRMVLDGALDPSLERAEIGLGQAVGFENALRAYVQDCQAGDGCPLTGDLEDGLAQVRGLVDRAARSPLPTQAGRDVTGALAFTGIAYALYDDAAWPVLTEALTAAVRQEDGSLLLFLADQYNDRNEDGTFSSNTQEAFVAINCLDNASSPDLQTMEAEAAALREAAPTVGEFFAYGGLVCAQWPHPQTGTVGPISAEGAAPILVIGTTNDPATPYAWAEALADQLSSGVLLTYQGEGHTAYGRSNACIAEAVDGFLVEGTVPEDGTRC